MNIKEYVKEQAKSCKNEIMKEIFIDLVDKFFPKPKPKTEYNGTTIYLPSNKNTTYLRRVLVKTDSKNYVGLIDEDGHDIKLPNNQKLEYQLVCHSETGTFTYYTGLNEIFFKEKDSRILKPITYENYLDHKSNIHWCIAYMDDSMKAQYRKLIGQFELDRFLDEHTRANNS